MKTLKIKIFAFVLILLFMSIVFLSHARHGNGFDEVSDREYFELYLEAEDLIYTLEEPVIQHPEITIYDPGNDLVITGNEDNEEIQNYLKVSDFLTEVNDTKYYYLSN